MEYELVQVRADELRAEAVKARELGQARAVRRAERRYRRAERKYLTAKDRLVSLKVQSPCAG